MPSLWRAVVGMRANRQMQDGRTLKQLYRTGRRGQQVHLAGMAASVTVSWFWLHRAEGKRELRFVVSTYPYSGIYLVRLGRKRSRIEGFFTHHQASLWLASLWRSRHLRPAVQQQVDWRSNHQTRCLSLAHQQRLLPIYWRIGLTNGLYRLCWIGKQQVT